MKILPKYKVRRVADENVVLVQGRNAGDMTSVIALNDTSLYLWNELYGKDFELQDVVRLLTARFDVDEPTAARDAEDWLATLCEKSVVA